MNFSLTYTKNQVHRLTVTAGKEDVRIKLVSDTPTEERDRVLAFFYRIIHNMTDTSTTWRGAVAVGFKNQDELELHNPSKKKFVTVSGNAPTQRVVFKAK